MYARIWVRDRIRGVAGAGGGHSGQAEVRRHFFLILYLHQLTKSDVTSGQIGAQQPLSAKSNDGVRVRHDFFGFLSHQYQEL